MRVTWHAIADLFRRGPGDEFHGDAHTDYLQDKWKEARDQQLAAEREIKRISAGRRDALDHPLLPKRDGSPRR